MNRRVLTLLAFALIVFLNCSKPGKEYYIPEGINKDSRQHLVIYLDNGKALYKEFCSECHGIYSEVRDDTPSFTEYQLEMYKAKLSMKQGVQHGFTENLSYEEIEAILNFLRFKKPSKSKQNSNSKS